MSKPRFVADARIVTGTFGGEYLWLPHDRVIYTTLGDHIHAHAVLLDTRTGQLDKLREFNVHYVTRIGVPSRGRTLHSAFPSGLTVAPEGDRVMWFESTMWSMSEAIAWRMVDLNGGRAMLQEATGMRFTVPGVWDQRGGPHGWVAVGRTWRRPEVLVEHVSRDYPPRVHRVAVEEKATPEWLNEPGHAAGPDGGHA